jgi:predicted small secreted protein
MNMAGQLKVMRVVALLAVSLASCGKKHGAGADIDPPGQASSAGTSATLPKAAPPLPPPTEASPPSAAAPVVASAWPVPLSPEPVDAGSCTEIRNKVRVLIQLGKTTCIHDEDCGTYGSWLDEHPCGNGVIDRATAVQLALLSEASRVGYCSRAACDTTYYTYSPRCASGRCATF